MEHDQHESYHRNGDSVASRIPSGSTGGSALASASLILGIAALGTCLLFTIYLPFILGSIAVLLALLSKGQSPRLDGKAKIGICVGILAIFLNITLITAVLILYGDLIMEAANEMYRNLTLEMYGIPQDLPHEVLDFWKKP